MHTPRLHGSGADYVRSQESMSELFPAGDRGDDVSPSAEFCDIISVFLHHQPVAYRALSMMFSPGDVLQFAAVMTRAIR
jgi:hypothetical protein